MQGTPHEQDHRSDLWNYFYRGLLSFTEVALVFKDIKVEESIHSFSIVFEKEAGKDYTEGAQTEN